MSEFVENYLAFLLAKASHQISGSFHRRLKSLGVSISTWRILASLNDGDRTVGELAELVLLNQPTLSKTLDKLVAEGLVERHRDSENRRIVMINITGAGMDLVNRLIPLANDHEAHSFAHLSRAEKATLVDVLQRTIRQGNKYEL